METKINNPMYYLEYSDDGTKSENLLAIAVRSALKTFDSYLFKDDVDDLVHAVKEIVSGLNAKYPRCKAVEVRFFGWGAYSTISAEGSNAGLKLHPVKGGVELKDKEDAQ